jgi:hypothetical protein
MDVERRWEGMIDLAEREAAEGSEFITRLGNRCARVTVNIFQWNDRRHYVCVMYFGFGDESVEPPDLRYDVRVKHREPLKLLIVAVIQGRTPMSVAVASQ